MDSSSWDDRGFLSIAGADTVNVDADRSIHCWKLLGGGRKVNAPRPQAPSSGSPKKAVELSQRNVQLSTGHSVF